LPGSKAIDPPPADYEALAPTAIPSGSERADPPARRYEQLAAPNSIPSEPAGPTQPQEVASGIPNSSAHRAEQVGHDRHGTPADSGRRSQRDTNVVTIMHRTGTSSHTPPARTRRRPAPPERCKATPDATRCAPVRRVRARGPTAHGAGAPMAPSAPPWTSAPGRFQRSNHAPGDHDSGNPSPRADTPLQILTSTTATAGRINDLDGAWAPY
jgi:hypothetical protein